jgi:hypothetical protein
MGIASVSSRRNGSCFELAFEHALGCRHEWHAGFDVGLVHWMNVHINGAQGGLLEISR